MDLTEAFQTEIRFWEEMLSSQTEHTDPDILLRMKMAKRLAEKKLQLYRTECSGLISLV